MELPELSIEGWAKVVGATSATIALCITLWKPTKTWLRSSFDSAVISALKRCKKALTRLVHEDILAEELLMLDQTRALVDANIDRLSMIDAAIQAQGVALAELPRIAGQMEGLPRAIESLSQAMMEMSENVGIIRGKMEERDRWDGEERRHGERRRNDREDQYDRRQE